METLLKALQKTLDEFNKPITVVQSLTSQDGNRYLERKDQGYKFSQREMLSDIDLAYNSIYKNGKYDTEGQRKAFLNVVRFYVQVAKKNTQPKMSQFVFSPVEYSLENVWGTWFTNRQFHNWLRDTEFAKENDYLHTDFCKYGTAVAKRIGETITRVPLRSIYCDQSATTLLDGVKGGTALAIEHRFSYFQVLDFKSWKRPDKYEGKRKYYETYLYLTRQEYEAIKGRDSTDQTPVLTIAIVSYDKRTQESKRDEPLDVLFCEEITEDEFPFEEVHSEKIDGRWLGLGNVEKQLENQIARNVAANMRRRSMMWASKRIFQSQGDTIGKNLVKNVSDGEILSVGLNGIITPVNTASVGNVDFAADEQIWNENGQQQSFAFEAVTGETLPSGTPFRLGAVLSNSAMDYFVVQRGIYGRFMQELFYDKLLPIFEKRSKDDIAIIGSTQEGFAKLRKMFIDLYVNDYYTKLAFSDDLFNRDIPSEDVVRTQVEKNLYEHDKLYVTLPKDVYKNARYNVEFDPTGAEQNTPADRETLVTLYTELSRKGDARADRLLDIILASTGKNTGSLLGDPTKTAPAQQEPNANLQGLINQ